MDFCKWTEKLWKIYFSSEGEKIHKILDYVDENCVIIGTGAHELYEGLEHFLPEMDKELKERREISFECRNYWSRQVEVLPDACLVYGGLRLWWESDDHVACIDMDTRFSVLYRRKDGQWKAVHIHQSVPNKEQAAGEYYPKSLVERVKEVQEIADKMTELAQKDAMTGLINYRAFEKIWETWEEEESWLFLIDFDNFKRINDTYGHVAGNRVLRRMARILEASVRARDVVCRMGGDEFLLLCGSLRTRTTPGCWHREFWKMSCMGGWRRTAASGLPSPSEGRPCAGGEALETTMNRADQALYYVKRAISELSLQQVKAPRGRPFF